MKTSVVLIALSLASGVWSEVWMPAAPRRQPAATAVLASEFVFETAPFASAHASTIVETREGLVTAWFGGSREGAADVGIWLSRQVKGEWTRPIEVATGTQPDGGRHPCWNPVLFQAPDTTLMLFYKVGPSPQTWWGVVRTSRDSGRTWSDGRRLPDGILGPVKNKFVQLSDGTLVAPSSTESAARPSTWRVHFERTADAGLTWTSASPPPPADGRDINAIQPSILVHPGGRLQAIGRTQSQRVFETWSDDGGRSWTPLSLTALPNPNAGIDAVTLRDGRHLVVYNHTTQGRSPLNVAVSRDGKTWEAALVLENEPGEYSYPAVIQGADGRVHITYTWKRLRIKHVVLDPVQLKSTPMVDGSWPAADLPSFDRELLLETSSETSANVSIGDVNGDGYLDLVLAKGRHWPLVDRVLLGDGRGHIASAYNLGDAADRSYSGRLADMDGDGDLDVVISNDTPDPKLVYLNDGKGHFHVGSTYGRAEWDTRNASVADLNGDGRPDIIVANRTEKGANFICLNKGQGTFDADCLAFSHESATTISAADFNHDGIVDLAVPHRDGGQSYVYLNDGHASFSNLKRIPFGPPDATFRMAEAADLDGDGAVDIVTIDERRGVAVYFGQKDGAFSPGLLIDDGKVVPYALAVGDLNGDRKIDIIVGHVEAPSTIYVNDGSGRHYSSVRFGDARGTVYGFAIGDLDRDGRLDIAVARSEAPNVVYFGATRPGKGR